MKIRTLCGIFTVLAAAVLAGCGGSGGKETAAPVATVVQGTASKGLIANGTVRIYALNPDGSKVLLKETATDAGGNYTADISPYTGPVLVEAFGTYTDEATGTPMTITADAPLRGACPNASGTVNLAVTPITDLAVRQAATLTAASITAANQAISDIFKFDVAATQPVAPISSVLYNGRTTQSQIDYTLALAAVSQMGNGAPVTSTLASLADGITGTTLSPTAATNFQSALAGFLSNPNNQTGAIAGATNLTTIGSRTAVIRLSSSGSAAGTIAGIELTVGLPAGVSVTSNRLTGELLEGVLAASGVVPQEAYLAGKYSPQSATVKLALVSATTFGAGEFAALTVNLPAGSTFTADDFAVSGIKFADINGQPIGGVSVTRTVSLQ